MPEKQSFTYVDPRSRKLEKERLDVIMATLIEAGQSEAAEDLSGHVAALEEELMLMSQYYEEFLIPEMEGRRIGRGTGRMTTDISRSR